MNPVAIALSGLTAATTRLAVGAANIANALTPGRQPDAIAAAPLPDGLAAVSNVDLAAEMVTQMTALHAYRANLETIRTAGEMQGELLKVV